jgi:hypothetical protein
MQSPLQALQEYYRAFSSLELDAIVSYFSEPCMSIGLQGLFSAGSRTELAKAFTPFVQGLRAKGYSRSEFEHREVAKLSESVVLVRGVAIRYMADGETERVPISYLMHLTDARWKIAVMVLPL